MEREPGFRLVNSKGQPKRLLGACWKSPPPAPNAGETACAIADFQVLARPGGAGAFACQSFFNQLLGEARDYQMVHMIGIQEQELPWLRLLTSLLRNSDPVVPEFARQSLLYVAENAGTREALARKVEPLLAAED